jgi:hypothetical protein
MQNKRAKEMKVDLDATTAAPESDQLVEASGSRNKEGKEVETRSVWID